MLPMIFSSVIENYKSLLNLFIHVLIKFITRKANIDNVTG